MALKLHEMFRTLLPLHWFQHQIVLSSVRPKDPFCSGFPAPGSNGGTLAGIAPLKCLRLQPVPLPCRLAQLCTIHLQMANAAICCFVDAGPTRPAALALQVNDAYTVLLRERKLPMSLLEDPETKRGAKALRSNLLQMQPFQ